jgi:hypothetical protein
METEKKRRKSKLNQDIEKAIEAGCPMYWTYSSFSNVVRQFILKAVTYTYENGRVRTKTVFRSWYLSNANRVNMRLWSYSKYDQQSWKDAESKHWLTTGELMSYTRA